MELKDLKGKYILSGFDTCIPNMKCDYDELVNGVCFVLDGKEYQIYEDRGDGYRSYSSELMENGTPCKNMFEGIEITIIHDEGILKMISCNTGELICELGTDYNDGYYPFYVSRLEVEQLDKEKKG